MGNALNGWRIEDDAALAAPPREALQAELEKHRIELQVLKNYDVMPAAGYLLWGPYGLDAHMNVEEMCYSLGLQPLVFSGWEISIMEDVAEEIFAAVKETPNAMVIIHEIEALKGLKTEKIILGKLIDVVDRSRKMKPPFQMVMMTCDPDYVSPELKRLGRLDQTYFVPLPSFTERKRMLEIELGGLKVDMDGFALLTVGYSFNDIKQACREIKVVKYRKKLKITEARIKKILEAHPPNIRSLAVYRRKYLDRLSEMCITEKRLASYEVRVKEEHTTQGGGAIFPIHSTELAGSLLALLEEQFFHNKQFNERGCILWGPPGTGRCRMAKALAYELRKHGELEIVYLDCKHFNKAEDVLARFSDVSESGKKCIVILNHVNNKCSNTAQRPATPITYAILRELEKLQAGRVFVFGIANHPEDIDQDILQVFAGQVHFVELPDDVGRETIWRLELEHLPGSEAIDYATLVEQSEGCSGKHIMNVVSLATRDAIDRDIGRVRRGEGLARPAGLAMEGLLAHLRACRPVVKQHVAHYAKRFRANELIGSHGLSFLVNLRERQRDVAEVDTLRLIIFGPPACGKGTQSQNIAKQYCVVHLSTGDMLRAQISARTPFGQKAEEYLNRGELVPDHIVIGMIRERILKQDCKENGFLLDGFPRTEGQARSLDEMLAPLGITHVLNLQVPEKRLEERFSGRRVHLDSGRIYHLTHKRPLREGLDDVTGQPLSVRPDDTPERFKKRVEEFRIISPPVLQYFREKGVVHDIDGSEDGPNITWKQIDEIVGGHRALKKEERKRRKFTGAKLLDPSPSILVKQVSEKRRVGLQKILESLDVTGDLNTSMGI